jgi:hypothetical protein
MLPPATPLNRRYDVDRLAADVRTLRTDPWLAQKSIGQDGVIRRSTVDWTILPLRSAGGDPERTDAGGAGLAEHAETPHLARAPYLTEVLRGFPVPLLAARLMALGPGTRVREHRDAKCGLPWGLVRLHVPIVTNPAARVVIDGHDYHWDAGRLWFGDFDRPHFVSNDGTESRVHLVLDCLVTDALLELFPPVVAATLPAAGIVRNRPPVPASVSAPVAPCAFAMPARFAEWSEEEPVAAAGDTLPAAVSVDGGRAVLEIDGRPRFGLVHLGDGEFRLAGWSEERTLRIDPPAVTFTIRRGSDISHTRASVA